MQERLGKALDDWTIRTIGIVDSATFLVLADWDPKDNPTRKCEEGEDTLWTIMLFIDISSQIIKGKVSHGGLGKTYCDGALSMETKRLSLSHTMV